MILGFNILIMIIISWYNCCIIFGPWSSLLSFVRSLLPISSLIRWPCSFPLSTVSRHHNFLATTELNLLCPRRWYDSSARVHVSFPQKFSFIVARSANLGFLGNISDVCDLCGRCKWDMIFPHCDSKNMKENIEITLQDEASGFIIFVSSRVKLRNARKTCLSLGARRFFSPPEARCDDGATRWTRYKSQRKAWWPDKVCFQGSSNGDIFRKYVLRLDVLKSF